MKQQLPNMEFGRRLAAERDLEKSDQFNRCNISRSFDKQSKNLHCMEI